MYTVELGFDEIRRAGANVARGTFHLGVRRVLIGDELRLHRLMAGLSAKLDGAGDAVGLVASDCADEQEHGGGSNRDGQVTPVLEIGEIDDQLCNACLLQPAKDLAP
jgi:hypothetical protein